ncbi:helix-turn-helix domain-containing protein [Nocardia transvalensis]|uniref:helix-turn-helix domain-containing protein n=1 Tax=Nocardia transvalensis TaxID=37333 RepID=UPI001894213F|nr:helix-turn-helix transcriptional regulator [Nocardia transvalensis]MBF6333598.1 helix-turn-helix domain-containing protein [Nocardia transvalensis]
MGRKRNPIEDPGPIGNFARRLRARVEKDSTLTYRQLASRVNYSHSTLAAALSGKRFPTWESAAALLRACGAGEEEIEQWHDYWQDTRLRLAGKAADLVPTPQGWVVEPEFEPDSPDLSGYDDWRPRPEFVDTFDELAFELRRFRAAVGNPPLRALLMDVETAPGPQVSSSATTLSEIFNGKRRPKLVVFRKLLVVLLIRSNTLHGVKEMDRSWKSEHEWVQAWNRAEFHRMQSLRPAARDREQPAQTRAPNTDDPTITSLAANRPKELIALLTGMKPADASRVITALPETSVTEILTAILEHFQAKPRTAIVKRRPA